MDARRATPRRVVRVVILVIIVVVISHDDAWDIAYKLLIVSLHGVWEYLDAPLVPADFMRPDRLVKLAKDAVFELVKR